MLSLIVGTKQTKKTLTADVQIIKRRELKLRTTKNYQITNEDDKRGRKKGTKEMQNNRKYTKRLW